MQTRASVRSQRAFTMIELLVVIAIIAILAAILFPVFARTRESARQGSAMNSMHNVYLGARLFYEDEGRYPTSLFGYAEIPVVNSPYDPNKPLAAPARPSDTNIVPMDQATGNYYSNAGMGPGINKGYLYREQVKDFESFLDPDNLVGNKQDGKRQVTSVVYPSTLPKLKSGYDPKGTPVVWAQSGTNAAGCSIKGDTDFPTNPSNKSDATYYDGAQKVYYKMDSMDIGPAIGFDASGNPFTKTDAGGNTIYELHYSPDWTQERYNPTLGCDEYINGNPIPNQLKYKNPPTEQTVLTYITEHVATAGSNNVLILLMSGTARSVNARQALDPIKASTPLPLGYK